MFYNVQNIFLIFISTYFIRRYYLKYNIETSMISILVCKLLKINWTVDIFVS